MYKKFAVLATAAAMLVMMSASAASSLTSPNWNLNGTYTIPFTETVGPDPAGPYPYSVTIDVTSSATGEVTGTGFYITGGGYPAVTVTGQVTGWDVTLNLSYDDPVLATYNPFVLTGKIDQNGGMSGTAIDGHAREFTWLTTSGTVSLFSDCPAGATFVPATGGTIDLGTVPGHKYGITASGTYFAGGAGTFDIQADAEYSQDAIQRAADAAWTDSVNGYEGYGEILLDLMIDGQNVDWGAYNATHTYTLDKVATDGTLSFAFDIYDIYAPNNTGGLCVSLTDMGIGTLSGFSAPVNNMPADNVAKAGQTIPLKFRVLDWNGDPISSLSDVEVTSVKGINGAGENDALEAYAAGASGLQYLGDGYWQFNWKTQKDWAGTGRTVTVAVGDVGMLQAEFLFR